VVLYSIYLLFRGRASRLLLATSLMMLGTLALGLAWNLFMFSRDPVLAGWTAQNVTRSFHPLQYLLAYGPALWLLPWAAARLWGGRRWPGGSRGKGTGIEGAAFLGIWILVTALLIYAPVAFQRRLIEGVELPIVLLSSAALVNALADRAGKARGPLPGGALGRRAIVLMTAVVIFSSASSGLQMARGVMRAAGGSPPWFASEEELRGMAWLEANALPGSVVLASVETGNRLPRFTHCRVFAGHFCQTRNYERKKHLVTEFFDRELPEEVRGAFLSSYGIEWLYCGPAERNLGAFDPGTSPLFAEAFRAGSVIVYRVLTSR